MQSKYETEFVEMVASKSKKDTAKQPQSQYKELQQSTSRVEKLDAIIQQLYEDKVEGKLIQERFDKLITTYETEQQDLERQIASLQESIKSTEQTTLNAQNFLKQVRQVTEIKELTPELILLFVDKIIIEKPEKVEGTRAKKQTIWIYWNYIGILYIEQTA